MRCFTLIFLLTLTATCWQANANGIEGVAYGLKVLLKSDGTWEYSEESIKAKDKHGKAVVLKSDNTWEYVELQSKGVITFHIAALNDIQRTAVKRDDEGKVIGVEVGTGCGISLEVGNMLDVPIKFDDSIKIAGEITDVLGFPPLLEWRFYIGSKLVPPGKKGVFNTEPSGLGVNSNRKLHISAN